VALTIQERINPQAREALDGMLTALPGGLGAIADLTDRRTTLYAIVAAESAAAAENVRVVFEDRTVGAQEDFAAVRVRIYRPAGIETTLPAIVYLHGGGLSMGNLALEHNICLMLAEAVTAVVVAVDYRLAPENPFPAASDDTYAALRWVAASSAELTVDPDRIAIVGMSAGANLAAGVALRARDAGGPSLRLQMLGYPMVDDTNTTASSHEFLNVGVWDRLSNIEAWTFYLGDTYGTDRISRYAAPARASDLAGLPPTYIDIAELDVMRDEGLTYATRLVQAEVATELHLHPGAFHAVEIFASQSDLAQRIWALRISALNRALTS
jgi:acetyl esterase/lipase